MCRRQNFETIKEKEREVKEHQKNKFKERERERVNTCEISFQKVIPPTLLASNSMLKVVNQETGD